MYEQKSIQLSKENPICIGNCRECPNYPRCNRRAFMNPDYSSESRILFSRNLRKDRPSYGFSNPNKPTGLGYSNSQYPDNQDYSKASFRGSYSGIASFATGDYSGKDDYSSKTANTPMRKYSGCSGQGCKGKY
ncbi:MAG: hypothetical protein Q8N99_02110 [Nanoarchaeota archaeon]|nr:hypothetical protein [Nanoarchaeota archaeon]